MYVDGIVLGVFGTLTVELFALATVFTIYAIKYIKKERNDG